MSTWRPCPNGCGKDVRAYWPDGVFDGEPVPDANDCLWCEGSFTSGAAVAFGLMGMGLAIQAQDHPHPQHCAACGKPTEEFVADVCRPCWVST